MELLEGLAAIAELTGQPVEQQGVGRQLAHAAEVIGRIDDAGAKVPEPGAVDDGAPGKRIGLAGDPFRES